MMSASTSISSSMTSSFFTSLLKSGSSLNRSGTNLVLSPLFSLRQKHIESFIHLEL
jgi:hypothetical protein